MTLARLQELIRLGVEERAIDPKSAYLRVGILVWIPIEEAREALEQREEL